MFFSFLIFFLMLFFLFIAFNLFFIFSENTGDDLKGDRITLSDIVDGNFKPRRFNGSWIAGKNFNSILFFYIFILFFAYFLPWQIKFTLFSSLLKLISKDCQRQNNTVSLNNRFY